MKIRNSYTTGLRITMWGVAAHWFYGGFINPEYFEWWKRAQWFKYWLTTYEKYMASQEYIWTDDLRRWSNIDHITERPSLGSKSYTQIDEIVFGPRKFSEPPAYDRIVDEFITLAENLGEDPARHYYETIRKMVDAYYPHDLDPNPNETKRVRKPQMKWVYGHNLDAYVADEESKPKPNSMARYLWFVPGFQQHFDKHKLMAQQEEEETLLKMTPEERQIFYETTEAKIQRWSMELNDYLPLLAYRWDRKLKLAQYLMNEDNIPHIQEIIQEPGGVRQMFIEAGVLSEKMAGTFENGRLHEY